MTSGREAADASDGGRALEGLRRIAGPQSGNGKGSGDVLRRFLSPEKRKRPGEECEMCATPIAEEHSHVVNLATRKLLCTCRGCYLLFTHGGAAQGKYRAVPDRYLYDPAFAMTEAQWQTIQIPVNMAFFFYNSSLEKVVAFYPSPAGATESLLSLETWDEVVGQNPAFADMVADVEALLVRRADDGFECYLVPIDAAYDLVGRVKLHWKGFDGGQEAWSQIEAFFSALRDRSRSVTSRGPDE